MTEVDYYKTDEEGARPAAETQELIRRLVNRVETLQMPGFIGLSWGVAVEDGARGVSLVGWRSVEVGRSSVRS